MAEIKTDCFAYKEGIKKCVALKELYCAKGNCSFYKSKNNGKENKKHE